jgi:hypothetical protein
MHFETIANNQTCTITENRRRNREKDEETKTKECRSQMAPPSQPNYTTRDEKDGR